MVVPAERKRPWYLVLALLGALALGTARRLPGVGHVRQLPRARSTPPSSAPGIADEADRAALHHRASRRIFRCSTRRSRAAWPLGVATLVLGTAIFVFAMRALGGSGAARAVLVQLVVAQAGINAVSYWLLRDVFEAELRVREAEDAATSHDNVPERDQADSACAPPRRCAARATRIALALDTLGQRPDRPRAHPASRARVLHPPSAAVRER